MEPSKEPDLGTWGRDKGHTPSRTTEGGTHQDTVRHGNESAERGALMKWRLLREGQ